MGIRYIGNCEWEPVSRPDWTVDSWGVDRARWEWTGRVDKMAAFLQTLTGFKTLPAWSTSIPANSGVRLLEYSENNSSRPYMPTIELSFAGFRSGRIPPPKATNSTSAQSAQGQGDYTLGGDVYNASGTILYRANRTTWEWFETSKPAALPRYAVVQDAQNPFDAIVRASITATHVSGDNPDDPPPNNSIPYAAFATVFRSLVPVQMVSDYTKTPILPDALWACSATVDYVLQ